MCGRYSITKSQEQIETRFNARFSTPLIFKPRYNAAPTQQLPVIVQQFPDTINFLRWGLVPPWAKNLAFGNRTINARLETLPEKPAFSQAILLRRCLVPADGYYEWQILGSGKVPFRIVYKEGLFAMAGLWEIFTSPEGQRHETFTIITRQAVNELSHIHHRTPLILPRELETAWLREGLSALEANYFPNELGKKLSYFPVSDRVGNVKNDDPDLIKPFHRPTQGTLF